MTLRLNVASLAPKRGPGNFDNLSMSVFDVLWVILNTSEKGFFFLFLFKKNKETKKTKQRIFIDLNFQVFDDGDNNNKKS